MWCTHSISHKCLTALSIYCSRVSTAHMHERRNEKKFFLKIYGQKLRPKRGLGDLLFFIRVQTLVIGVCKHLPWCSEVLVSLILNCCCQISIVVAVSILCCVNKVVVVVFVESFCCETCWPPYLPASNTSI